MTDWKRAGELADAHLIRNRLRRGYDYEAKRRVRERAIKFLARFNPTLALDLWSGGLSADAMTAAGLAVLSVDNFSQSRLRKDRAARAIAICGEEGGYEGLYGDAAAHAERADVALLDFHGHLSKPMLATLEACRHMKAAVVVALAARAPLGTGIGEGTWERMYRTAIADAIGMTVDWSMQYRSPNDQPMIVIALHNTGRPATCANPECANPVVGSRKSRYCWRGLECKRRRTYLAHQEDQRARARRWRIANPEKVRARDAADAAARRAAKGTRKCQNCGSVFVPWKTVSVFCLRPPCRLAMRRDSWQRRNARIAAARRPREPRECRGCGDAFIPHGRQVWCTQRCRNRAIGNRWQRSEKGRQRLAALRAERMPWRIERQCRVCATSFVPFRANSWICKSDACRLARARSYGRQWMRSRRAERRRDLIQAA